MPGKCPGFENGEPKDIERFVGVPAVLGAVEPDEEYAVGNFRTTNRARFRRVQELGVSCDHLLFRMQ